MNDKEEIIRYRINKAEEEIRNSELSFENNLFNSSVSASYYAIFHSARALLAAAGLASKKHSGVIHLFSEHFIKSGIMEAGYGKILTSAFKQRNDSDYMDLFYSDPEDAKVQIANAKDFLKKVREILLKEYNINSA